MILKILSGFLGTKLWSNLIFWGVGFGIGWYLCLTMVADKVQEVAGDKIQTQNNVKDCKHVQPIHNDVEDAKASLEQENTSSDLIEQNRKKDKAIEALKSELKNVKPKTIIVPNDCQRHIEKYLSEHDRVNNERLRIKQRAVDEANR